MGLTQCNGVCSRLPNSKNPPKKYQTHNFCPTCGMHGIWFPKSCCNENKTGSKICSCCRSRLRTKPNGIGRKS